MSWCFSRHCLTHLLHVPSGAHFCMCRMRVSLAIASEACILVSPCPSPAPYCWRSLTCSCWCPLTHPLTLRCQSPALRCWRPLNLLQLLTLSDLAPALIFFSYHTLEMSAYSKPAGSLYAFCYKCSKLVPSHILLLWPRILQVLRPKCSAS